MLATNTTYTSFNMKAIPFFLAPDKILHYIKLTVAGMDHVHRVLSHLPISLCDDLPSCDTTGQLYDQQSDCGHSTLGTLYRALCLFLSSIASSPPIRSQNRVSWKIHALQNAKHCCVDFERLPICAKHS